MSACPAPRVTIYHDPMRHRVLSFYVHSAQCPLRCLIMCPSDAAAASAMAALELLSPAPGFVTALGLLSPSLTAAY